LRATPRPDGHGSADVPGSTKVTTPHVHRWIARSAIGPGAALLVGHYENTHIFEAMRKALDLPDWLSLA
jgi:alkaline phosphatase